MIKKILIRIPLVLALLTAGLTIVTPARADVPSMTAEQAVAAATDNFYAALNTMFTGDGQAMKDAWSHADDITYMGPGGNYLKGWDAIGAEWDLQTSRKLGGVVTPTDVHIIVGGDLALLNCIESGSNIVDGKEAIVNIRSSTVFRNENGVWKAISHQTDMLSFL